MKLTVGEVLLRLRRIIPFESADDSLLPVKKAFKTNILEDDGEELETITYAMESKATIINVVVKPFEVVTLRLEV